MARLSWRSLIALAVVCVLISAPAQAGWEIGDEAELMESSLRLRNTAGSPDGMGGMLLMAIDQGGSPPRISVTRVDHTGTEVWGDNGFWLPQIVGDTPYFVPSAVTSDGQGGGYFAYHATSSGSDYLKVAYVDAGGSWLWTTAIDNLGASGSDTDSKASLVTTGAGNVIIIFERSAGGPILYSVCVDQTGTILWHGPIQDTFGWDSYAIAKSDGLGGAFIAYWRNWTPDEVRVQRLNESNGARVWGTDGALVWSGAVGSVQDVEADGVGGGYLVRDNTGVAYAQHVNASGLVTWVSDVAVHDTQTMWWAQSTQPRLCTDGAGGFILFHGLEDLFAQRVDVNGSLLWGGGVAVADTVDIGCPRTISPDGFGGAIVTFEDKWTISGSSTLCDQVNGARIDTFGTVSWTNILGWCDFSYTPTVPEVHRAPHTVRGFGDGSGGGMFGWVVDDVDGSGDGWMWGMGIDAGGGEPTPRVTFLHPDSAQPGASGPYLILGDYLDLGLGYTLEEEDGSPSLGLTPTDLHSHQMVGGTTTLSGLTQGAYHLKTDDGGTLLDTFEYAVGIGDPPGCDPDHVILGEERAVNLAGSQRQATRTPDGVLHVVWIEYEPTPRYHVNWFTWDGWWEERRALYSAEAPLREPTLTSDASGNLHLAFVEEINATHDQLRYMRIEEEGIAVNVAFDPGEVIRNPVIGWTDDDLVHVVMERGASPGNDLLHVQHDGSRFDSGVSVTTNGSPRTPDLATMGSQLELVWASNSAIPGLQMIERTTYEGGGWHPPELMSLGVVMTSPSVAWDGDARTLYAWIMNNEIVNGIPPLVHTQLRVGDEMFEARARPGWSHHQTVSVASPTAGKFVMVTSESEGGPIVRVVAREGDGHVFFPRRQLNTLTDLQYPRFAIQPGGALINVWWHSFGVLTEPVVGVDCEITATSAPTPDVIVIDHRLVGRPNPFNPGTAFEFELSRDSYVVLEVFDLRGRLVKTLHRGVLGSGPQAVEWDGTDEHGMGLASGTYLARLKRDDGSTSVAKVALLK